MNHTTTWTPEAIAEFLRTHPCRTPILCVACGREFKTRRGVDAHECSRRFKTMQKFDRWYVSRGYRALGQPRVHPAKKKWLDQGSKDDL